MRGGLVVRTVEGRHGGNAPLTATFRFTEKAFLLHHHHANRISPLGSTTNPKSSSQSKHSGSINHEQALLGVPDAWTAKEWEELQATAAAIPSGKPLNQRSLMTLAGKTHLTPSEALAILRAAGEKALTLTHVMDARAWALRVLTKPDFADAFRAAPLPVVVAPIEPVLPTEPLAALPTEAEALKAILAPANLDPGGAMAAVQGMARSGVGTDLAPYLLAAATARASKGGVTTPKGLLVHLLRAPDHDLLAAARKRQSEAAAKAAATYSACKGFPWERVAPSFRAFPGADAALAAFAKAECEVKARKGDDPGYNELVTTQARAEKALVELAKVALGREAVLEVERAVQQRFPGMAQEALPWVLWFRRLMLARVGATPHR